VRIPCRVLSGPTLKNVKTMRLQQAGRYSRHRTARLHVSVRSAKQIGTSWDPRSMHVR